MASYRHSFHLLFTGSDFSTEINDHVYNKLVFKLTTTDNDTQQRSTSEIIELVLPPPDPANFIPSPEVNKRTLRLWADQNIDMIALQDQNIANLGSS